MKKFIELLAAGLFLAVSIVSAQAADRGVEHHVAAIENERGSLRLLRGELDREIVAIEQLQAQLNMVTGAGGKFKAGGSAPPAYTGPADVAGWTSPYACWSLRACTSALRGTAVIDVCSNSSGACTSRVTVNSDASTGMPDLSGIGYSPIYVDKIYAQIGGAQNLDALAPARPTLVTNQLAGQPTIRCEDNVGLRTTNAATAISLPFSSGLVVRFTDTGVAWADAGFGVQLLGYISAGVGNRYQSLGSRIDYTGTDNIFESIINVYNGGSSSMRINNSSASNGDPGSNTPSTGWSICQASQAAFMHGDWFETIIKAGAVSAGDQTGLNNNQHTIGTGW